MYHYIIDQSRIPQRRVDRLLGEVYGCLAENQIGGEVHRVTKLRSLEQLSEKAADDGAKTIVVVGDDDSFMQVVDHLRDRSVVLGYIALDKTSEIAEILGLGDINENCRAIAQRRVEEFGIGQANRSRFFTRAEFGPFYDLIEETGGDLKGWKGIAFAAKARSLKAAPISIRVNNSYSLETEVLAGAIINARSPLSCATEENYHHTSRASFGSLSLFLVPKMSLREIMRYQQLLLAGCFEAVPGCTALRGSEFEINAADGLNVVAGAHILSKLPVGIAVSSHKVRIIVGKNR